MKYKSIAIDGPSGAGKSTLAKALARRLHFLYVDTGAIYRTIALYLARRGISPKDCAQVEKCLRDIEIGLRHEGDVQCMFLGEEEVTHLIRSPEISSLASDVSAIPAVRAYLLEFQRAFARKNNVIMDGRDIGTVVLPDADIKLFLTADPEDRARRRYEELTLRGVDTTYEEVLCALKKRDENDRSRSVAPLKPAADALIINTTGNSLEKSVAVVTKAVEERL